MKNKNGIITGVYLLLFTIIFMGIVIGFYVAHQQNTSSSLVSPVKILEINDNLIIYKNHEIQAIQESLAEANKVFEFGSENFKDSFRENFLGKIGSNEFINNIIFRDLNFEGNLIEEDARRNPNSFFSNLLYPNELFYYEGDFFVVQRKEVSKKGVLRGSYGLGINFPVEYSYSYGSKYLISLNDSSFEILEVK